MPRHYSPSWDGETSHKRAKAAKLATLKINKNTRHLQRALPVLIDNKERSPPTSYLELEMNDHTRSLGHKQSGIKSKYYYSSPALTLDSSPHRTSTPELRRY